MVTKVVLYFDVPGKFSLEEGNEIVRDLRLSIYKFIASTSVKSFSADLSSGKIIQISLITEEEAKERVNGGLKVKLGQVPKSRKFNPEDFRSSPPSSIIK